MLSQSGYGGLPHTCSTADSETSGKPAPEPITLKSWKRSIPTPVAVHVLKVHVDIAIFADVAALTRF
jgi:hypothetical protein